MTAARKLVKYYVRPILNNIKNKDSLNLGSSKLYFDRIELIKRNGKNISSKYLHLNEVNSLSRDISKTINIQLKKITKTRKKIKNLKFNKPLIMGILNVTPDSFSDGGEFLSVNDAFSQYKKLKKEGVIKNEESVVCILTGNILKDPEVVMEHHSGSFKKINSDYESIKNLL